MGDDRPGAYRHIVADGHSGHHRHVAANPDVIAHMDRTGILQSLVSIFDVQRVTGGVERAAWSYEDIVAKGDLSLVEDDAIGIAEEVVAYLNIISIVAKTTSPTTSS